MSFVTIHRLNQNAIFYLHFHDGGPVDYAPINRSTQLLIDQTVSSCPQRRFVVGSLRSLLTKILLRICNEANAASTSKRLRLSPSVDLFEGPFEVRIK